MPPDRSKDLDTALVGSRRADDEEVAGLVGVAEELRASLAVEAPKARSDRAFFVSAVAGRRRSGPSLARLAVPALAVASVLLALSVLSRTTLPGDPLYPVRRVLQTTGVTRSPIEDVDRLLRSAERAIERGERLENDRPVAAEDAAVSALGDLDEAEAIATEVGAPERLEAIAELKEEAADLLQDASEEQAERAADDSSDGSGPDH